MGLLLLLQEGVAPEDLDVLLEGAYSVVTDLDVVLEGAYSVVGTDPLDVLLEGAYTTGGNLDAILEGAYSVARQSHYEGDPPVEVFDALDDFASLNGIDLNDGTSTFLRPGVNLGEDGQDYDVIRHYDGSILLHDVHSTLVEMTVPIKLVTSDAATMKTLVDAIRSAAVAGGTFVWQDGDFAGGSPGAEESFTIAPTSASDATRDLLYVHRNIALWDLKLTRFPRS